MKPHSLKPLPILKSSSTGKLVTSFCGYLFPQSLLFICINLVILSTTATTTIIAHQLLFLTDALHLILTKMTPPYTILYHQSFSTILWHKKCWRKCLVQVATVYQTSWSQSMCVYWQQMCFMSTSNSINSSPRKYIQKKNINYIDTFTGSSSLFLGETVFFLKCELVQLKGTMVALNGNQSEPLCFSHSLQNCKQSANERAKIILELW